MGFFFVFLVFLVIILLAGVSGAAKSRAQKRGASGRTAPRKEPPGRQAQPVPREVRRETQTPKRASARNKTDAASETRPGPKPQKRENIVEAARENNRIVQMENDADADREDLLKGVYEVMVKGPNDALAFQRDFLAEGMDLLNSFQQ